MRIQRNYIYIHDTGIYTRDRLSRNPSFIASCNAIYVKFAHGDCYLTYEINARRFAHQIRECATYERKFRGYLGDLK